MLQNRVHFLWQDPDAVRGFRTGVSLHSHTMHSQECLSFLPRYLHPVPVLSQALRKYEQPQGTVDFARAYWTPPLAPAAALRLEREQIVRLSLQPVVSLTDHDDIEAGASLQSAAAGGEVPISVEWTVPYAESILHFGIHNLPQYQARQWMEILARHTANADPAALPEVLRELAQLPEVLIVFNHPFWLEEGIEEAGHRRALCRLLDECLEWIHAFELNGTRGWRENAAVCNLARAHGRPLISGGDRHGSEPSACLNLTNAGTFAEFISEIRQGSSTLLFMPQYREPMAMRVLEACWDILRPYPEYPERERWIDRVFYRGSDGTARPLSTWKDEIPWLLDALTGVVQACATTPLRAAMRLFLTERGEILR
jgi:hypothetical protein